jgi:DNA-binding transcriptional LysR family regulator
VLHLSQPALSHQIAAIERELGTPVIERLPRGIRPTVAGLAAAAEARTALAAADRAVLAGRGVAAAADGRIRIACAETMTAWVLVPVLRSWRRRFPGVQLDLKEYTSADRMLDVLVTGGTDIVVGPRPTRSYLQNRWFTTILTMDLACGLTSSRRHAVSCCRSRQCAPAARARRRS